MGQTLERLFHLSQCGTTVRTEVLAGSTTFFTLAYIIFVQPTVLSAAGMDFGSVFVATCLGSGIATLMMAFFANYPIAVAPAMGHNFYFAFAVVAAGGVPWRVALGAVALAGMLFVLTAGVGLRERLITAIPDSLKHAIAVGIGLLIATVGLQWAGVIVDSPGTLITLGDLRTAPVLVALAGFSVMAVLTAWNLKGALLVGLLVSSVVAWLIGVTKYQGLASLPPSMAPTFLELDVLGALRPDMITVIFMFLFLALFDSVGTLVAVADQAGLMRAGTLPRARGALLADAAGTVVGASFGTSTVTAYIESSTGVAAGGRTGLTAVVTAGLFFLALFFSPIVAMVGGGYRVSDELTLYPVIAPALIVVGTMMVRGVRRIGWDDPTEAIPAFLTILLMPLTVSITEGIAFGFISFATLKLLTGRAAETEWLIFLFAGLFLIRYIFLV
jgi:AGZA family xanthine/uracil permease-like MFS transporter